MEWLYENLINESRWIMPSVALAALLALRVFRTATVAAGPRTTATMCVYAGALVGTMACGHLLAVLLKAAAEGVRGSIPILVGLGLVLVVPSWFVLRHGLALSRGEAREGRETITVNLLLVGALLVTGWRNVPLAIPAVLNVIHSGARWPRVKQATAVVAVVFGALLLAGSVHFFVSGQSFENFSGMEVSSP